jgi:trimeric autotransporter adhesin
MPTFIGTNLDDIIEPPLVVSPARIFGLEGNDILTGSTGNDLLNGGTGADILTGGGGNDTYIIDDPGDEVNENAGEGNQDKVRFQPTDPVAFNTFDLNLTPGLQQVENLDLAAGTLNLNGFGNALNNLIIANDGNNELRGEGGNDRIFGLAGNDILNGGTGSDTLNGGDDDDTYFVDNPFDKITEGDGVSSGTDTVNSTASSYTLDVNVENLSLEAGAGDINGTGNDLDNVITGNEGKNVLDGGVGADRLIGGGGASGDTFFVDDPGDRVVADGMGDYVGNPNPTGAGVNTIFSSITLDLTGDVVESGNVYNLILTGSSDIDGTGNALSNFIQGNSGRNTLTGGGGTDYIYGDAGDDTLDGGDGNDILNGDLGADTFIESSGNDTYIVDNAGDMVIDMGAGSGNDKVKSSITYNLATNAPTVRDITLTGSQNITATGNSLNNFIVGNSGDNSLFGLEGRDYLYGQEGFDILNGGEGRDHLSGGSGSDRFVFDGDFANMGIDRIADFSAAEGDKIRLSLSTFSAIVGNPRRPISPSQFATVTNDSLADTSTAKIIYGTSSGKLYYNPDGEIDGFGDGGLFAVLSGAPSLGSGNFVLAA